MSFSFHTQETLIPNFINHAVLTAGDMGKNQIPFLPDMSFGPKRNYGVWGMGPDGFGLLFCIFLFNTKPACYGLLNLKKD
jgi:hypothetical protein